MLALRGWKARVALAVGIALAGSALGLYIALRPHLKPQTHTPTAAPTAVSVGSTTVSEPGTAEYLTVVGTSPIANAQGQPLDSTIGLNFNLPVDPAAVQSFFSVLPATEGTFSAGPGMSSVVFTPSSGFPSGTPVSVVLRKGLTSKDGFALQDDFSFGFLTLVAAQDVTFQSGTAGMAGMLFNSQSGSVDISLQLGKDIPSTAALKTYRATSKDLVAAFVYDAKYAYPSTTVDTTTMQLVDTRTPVKSGVAIKVAQPDGIYLLVIGDASHQYGHAWAAFSKYGVLLRQDDQKIVAAGQDLTTGETPTFDIAFYNLQAKVQKILSGTFTGTGEFAVKYPQTIDLAVATTGGQELVIPVGAPQSNGDNKVVGSLAQQAQIFLTTDRAAYQKGETVKYAGSVRLSNDQAYSLPAAMKVSVWAMGPSSPSRLVSQTLTVSKDGTFAGSFVIPAAAFNKDGTDAQLTLFAAQGAPGEWSTFFTVIQALGAHVPSARLTVTLDKPTYSAGDTIVASIAATDTSGKALAGKALYVNIYSTQFVVSPHGIPAFRSSSSWGVAVKENIRLVTDATGNVSYSFKANIAQKAADQQVTVMAKYGAGSTAANGARSSVVYQGAYEVFLLPSRYAYRTGEVVIAPFVVEARNGDRVPNAVIAYEFDKTDYKDNKEITTVVGSGTVTTDANGLGIVNAKYSGPAAWIVLKVKGKDVAGNVFGDIKSLNVIDAPLSSLGSIGTDLLVQLGVTTDKVAYVAGDSAHLTIKSPAALKVLMSFERGRIHMYKWLALAQGDNQVTLDLTPDLAPGFSLMFSYFQGGFYVTEGMPLVVNDPSRLLTVTVTPDQAAYAAGQTAKLDILITDSAGKPVAASLVIDGYDSAMSAYKFADQPSIGAVFMVPAPRGTNATSSLLGIGNWGGRCGGGGNQEQPAVTNPGQLALWLTNVTTDATGHATVTLPIAKKAIRLAVIAASPTTAVGQAEIDLGVQ